MKEVTIKIEEDVYEYFKAQSDDCNWPVEDFIALAAWSYYKMELKVMPKKRKWSYRPPRQVTPRTNACISSC